MRIVLTCPYSLETPGGVQVHVAGLAARLKRRGHAVLILAPGRGGKPSEDVRTFGRPIRLKYQGSSAFLALSPLSFRAIRTALRGFRPDVVHVHEPFIPSTSMYAAIASPAPVAATFHAFSARSRLLELAAPILRPIAGRIDAGIAVSDAAAGLIRRSFRRPILEVIPNGIDTEDFAQALPENLPPGPRIVWVNRLDPQKGFPVLLTAFARLNESHLRPLLIAAGDGRDRKAVERLPPGARERVLLLGNVDHARIPGLLAAADVFVSAALGRESFGIALVEAMAAGVPVVATEIPGYREVVRNGLDGLLVPPNDPSALAGALADVLTRPELAGRLKIAGKERASTFDWNAVAARLEELYVRITRSVRPTGRFDRE